jgi:hypothetical protein
MTNSLANIKFNTMVELKGAQTGEVFVKQCNAIHPGNLARMIAYGLANKPIHSIYMVALGNGGTYDDSAGLIHYNTPNTVGVGATLYNQTFPDPLAMTTDISTVVDGTGSYGTMSPISSNSDTISIVNISLTIPSTLPTTQELTDASVPTVNSGYDPANPNPSSIDYVFDFDELALIAKNPLIGQAGEPDFLLLTHIVFNPIAKTQNRELQLSYSLSISCS